VSAPTVFISSTAEDLGPYRSKTREAAEQAGFRVIGMESFEGRDERPLDVCREKIAQSDVVVAIVAHRYGWVPPDQPLAADGSRDRSITWLECEHARSLGKEVLAFVVSDKVPWPPEHMDDRTLSVARRKRAAPEQIAAAQRDVDRLGDFKQWGDSPIDASRANYDGNVGHPTPVGLYPLGATPEGVHDLAGNVWEWCDDASRPYEKSKVANPRGQGEDEVLRGGSWLLGARVCRAAYRLVYHPELRGRSFGFRVVVGVGGGLARND
jgi:hypothetical protein